MLGFEGRPEIRALVTADAYLQAIRAALEKLRDPRLQQLTMIKQSRVYLDRMVQGLHKKLDHIAKLGNAIKDTKAKEAETGAALVSSTVSTDSGDRSRMIAISESANPQP